MELTNVRVVDSVSQSSIENAMKGDKTAFSNLLRENYNTIYRISYSILKNDADVEDALQEATLRAYKGISKLKYSSFFKTWLIKIVINESYNILKKTKKHLEVVNLEDANPSTEDRYENPDVKSAIMQLEKDLRLVIVLFYYEDMPVKAIADILSIPEGTVKSRLSRARTKLQEELKVKEE
ncbi:MAG: sigma-70 family RNA polymerase sigma factor [Bacillota bacterium]|nr:sigma-70 family RNA polymerase sigma factor [Bacillota bacterium]